MIRHRSKSPKWRMKWFEHLKPYGRKVHRRIGNMAATSSTSRPTGGQTRIASGEGARNRVVWEGGGAWLR